MHEHIESLIISLSEAMQRAERRRAESEPRRRRPRRARSTYVPIHHDPTTLRLAG